MAYTQLTSDKPEQAATDTVTDANALRRENLQNAWAALRMIRETVETLGPPGILISDEQVLADYGPEPVHEATAIVEALRKLTAHQPPHHPSSMDPTARVLQDLYDSEINFMIATFWDAGFRVMLGDDMNGFLAETRVQTFAEAVQWLAVVALAHHPDSAFARKYRP